MCVSIMYFLWPSKKFPHEFEKKKLTCFFNNYIKQLNNSSGTVENLNLYILVLGGRELRNWEALPKNFSWQKKEIVRQRRINEVENTNICERENPLYLSHVKMEIKVTILLNKITSICASPCPTGGNILPFVIIASSAW